MTAMVIFGMPIFVFVFFTRKVQCGELDAIVENEDFKKLSNEEQIIEVNAITNFGRMRYDVDFRRKWGTFFIQTTNSNDAFAQIVHIEVFMLRRIQIAVVVVFMHDNWLAKSFIMMSNTLVMLMIIVHYKAHATGLDRWLEVFNELSLLVLTYFLFIFTEWVQEEDVHSNLGWVFTGIFVFNAFVNIILVTIL